MTRTEFFQTLFQFCDGFIELRPLPNSNDRTWVDSSNGFNSIDPFCETHQKSDLYFGVATRTYQGGGKKDIVNIPAVWCDVDFKETPMKVLGGYLERFPFKPTIIILSGGGVHLYWILKEPETDWTVIEDVNHRIADQLKGDKNACDAARILRIPDTINHKYPKECKVHRYEDFYYELEGFLNVLPESGYKASIEIKDPNWLPEAMQGVSEGNRNSTATKIAGYWINKVGPQDVLAILKMWNRNNSPQMEDRDLEKVVKSVSRYREKEPSSLIDNVYDTARMVREYQSYIETLKQNKFITGITNIDAKIRGVAGGEVLTIIARAGSFKTALLQNLLKNYVQNSDRGAVFFSLEMPVPSITERYYEMLNDMKGSEVERLYQDPEAHEIKHGLEQSLTSKLPNFFVVPVKISLPDIYNYIQAIEEKYQVKIGVIGIDYMGMIDGYGSSEYEVISNLSRGVKSTAKLTGLPVVLLSQVSRKGGEGETEITMDHGRGSGAIEESADFILGLWQIQKESTGGIIMDPYEYDLVCKILKNRKGPRGGKWILDLNPSTFAIGSKSYEYDPPKRNKQF